MLKVNSVITIVCASHTCLKQDVRAEAEIQEIALLPSPFHASSSILQETSQGSFHLESSRGSLRKRVGEWSLLFYLKYEVIESQGKHLPIGASGRDNTVP